MIEYKNIKKTYNGKKILDIKELGFDSGKIYGLKGANGSGKSTLCKILTKIEKADENINYPNIFIGYMPQVAYVFDMTVEKNIFLNIESEKAVVEKINNYLKIFNLSQYKNKNAKKLSGGEKQKLCLIRLLLKKYDLLILDEPTSSMDIYSMKLAEEEIKKYCVENNATILMVSHEEGELDRMTDNILCIENGKIR